MTGTVDWYEARVSDPIDVQRTAAIINSCYNINGSNPNLDLNDPSGYCALIERDPVLSARILRMANTSYFGGRRSIDSLPAAT